MHITYFTIEDIGSGLFRNQVINKLNAILAVDSDVTFEILILNSPLKYSKHQKILKEYRSTLSNRIKIKYYPVLPPLRYALSSVLQSNLILKWLELFCRLFVKVKGDIIHCRSYWPTIIASKVYNTPILFDLRSLYPAENVAAGKLEFNSREYKFWLKQENYCIHTAKVNSAVSEAMVSYINSIKPSSVTHLNPIIVNTEEIYFDAEERINMRTKLGWQENIILVYSGSLGVSGLNREALSNILVLFSNLSDNFRFLFLSSDSKHSIEELLIRANIPQDHFYITESNAKELYKWLSASDIGFHALPLQLDSDTRLGTKVVEYWVSGLPVIINKNVGAAVDIVSKYGIGLVVDELTNSYEGLFDEIKQLLTKNRREISNTGKSMFDSKIIAKKYVNSYKDCLKNNRNNKK
ncbi:glycosyltransferase [Flavobacterium sp. ZB4P13]|uniref:glycosyltransferase n=1 Tax=Flavobacterium sp. ZB4P13 TaxID=3401728 RepID=UPI003AAC5847